VNRVARVWSPEAGTFLLLAAAALVTAAAMTAAHLQGHRDQTLLYAAFGAAGMPMIPYWTPARCHAPTLTSSAVRFNHADLLGLLDRK
jgi:hypothetical protein